VKIPLLPHIGPAAVASCSDAGRSDDHPWRCRSLPSKPEPPTTSLSLLLLLTVGMAVADPAPSAAAPADFSVLQRHPLGGSGGWNYLSLYPDSHPVNGHSDTVSVIDPDAGKEVATIALPGRPEFAVGGGHGHVFVNLEDKGELARLDSGSDKLEDVWSPAPCDSPSGLAYDAHLQRLFSVCDNRLMVVSDAVDVHQVARVAIGKGPDAAAFDPRMRLIYSANHDGTLTIVHEDNAGHYPVQANVLTQPGARTLALDPVTHLAWLVAAAAAPRGAPAKGFALLAVGRH